MNYGRRAKTGRNGDVRWCALEAEEVERLLAENVELNARLLSRCVEEARRLASPRESESGTPDQETESLSRDAIRLALGLLNQCGIKGFVSLQAGLEAKISWTKEAEAALLGSSRRSTEART